jgi:hypothetical protein
MDLKTIFRLPLLIAASLQAQEYVDQRVTVGDSSFNLPVPSKYVAIDKKADWARAFFQAKEHVLDDESKNNTFVLAMQTPENFAISKKEGAVTGRFECWALYPNFSAKSRMSLKQFAALVSQAEAAFNKLDSDAKMLDFVGLKPDKIKDEQVRKTLSAMTKPTIISKTERSLVTIGRTESRYTLQAWLVINEKFLFLYLNADPDQLLFRINEMNSWIRHIEQKEQAASDLSKKPDSPNLGR